MRPVLTFFFDALKPESLQYMPFLGSFRYQRRLRTELGYSVTCHPTMYSGVHPNKHLQWFVWKYAPTTSPFGWARIFRYLGVLDNLPARYFLHRYTRQFREPNTAWFGVPLLVNLPLEYWPYFDVVEDRAWDEPGYLGEYPTIFDILRRHGTDFEVVGMAQGRGDEFVQIKEHEFGQVSPWTYFFLGSIDSYSHRYGQDGAATIERLRSLDHLVEAKFGEYSRRVSDSDVLVFSDHGHIPVEKQVDIHAHFRRHGHNLNRFIHLIEANYARFWFRSDKERAIVERILSSLEEGFVLTDDRLRRYHLEMPDHRYGDLVFYLDRPAVFSKTIWGFSRKQRSMHGYLPEYPGSDGVLLSQRPLVEGTHVDLVDVLPTILSSLDLPIPDYVDGRPCWAADEGAELGGRAWARESEPARYTALADPSVERAIDAHLQRIVAAVRSRLEPDAIILRGSFGRGEGSVLASADQLCFLSDYEIDVATCSPFHRSLFRELSQQLSMELGVETSLRWVRPDYLHRDRIGPLPVGPAPITISLYESRYGSRTLYGEDIAEAAPAIDPGQIRLESGVFLLLNRMAESLYHMGRTCEPGADGLRAYYWISKMILACAESLLLSWGQYHYSYSERGRRFAALAEGRLATVAHQGAALPDLVARATGFKLQPRRDLYPESVRELWLQVVPICDAVFRHLVDEAYGLCFGRYGGFPERFLQHTPNPFRSYPPPQRGMLKLLEIYKCLRTRRLPRGLWQPFGIARVVYAVVPLIFVGWGAEGEDLQGMLGEARRWLKTICRLEPPAPDRWAEWDALRRQVLWAWKNFCYM